MKKAVVIKGRGKRNIRRKNKNRRNKVVNDEFTLWKQMKKLDTYIVPNVNKITLYNEDRTSIEITHPGVKTVNKGNTIIIFPINSTNFKNINKVDDEVRFQEQTEDRYINRYEKRVKKEIAKISTKKINNIRRVSIKNPNMKFVIYNPDVFKLSKHNIYIIYGKQDVDSYVGLNTVVHEEKDVQNVIEDIKNGNTKVEEIDDIVKETVNKKEVLSERLTEESDYELVDMDDVFHEDIQIKV